MGQQPILCPQLRHSKVDKQHLDIHCPTHKWEFEDPSTRPFKRIKIPCVVSAGNTRNLCHAHCARHQHDTCHNLVVQVQSGFHANREMFSKMD